MELKNVRFEDTRRRVLGNVPLGPSVYRLECEGETEGRARTGQFVLIFPPGDSLLLGRPFAVAERTEGSFAVWYAVSGRGTRALTGLRPGDFVRVRGPLGNPFPEPEAGTRLRVVMGAIGAAPFALDAPNAEYHLGVPDGARWGGFVNWASRRFGERGGVLRVFSEDGGVGERGSALSGLGEELEPGDRVWACGPGGMLKALALKYKNRLPQIHVSLDTKMGCGYGGCLGCAVDTAGGKKRACADGPVFRADEVVWDAL
ncbi:MAG: hypothetical protein LBL51_00090 [Synergistaceae bacterium]|jgi:dihydroorotate dehydrogenase electron transfer subunit|nr:hypothetical protein [Synergistaceae bacterium]